MPICAFPSCTSTSIPLSELLPSPLTHTTFLVRQFGRKSYVAIRSRDPYYARVTGLFIRQPVNSISQPSNCIVRLEPSLSNPRHHLAIATSVPLTTSRRSFPPLMKSSFLAQRTAPASFVSVATRVSRSFRPALAPRRFLSIAASSSALQLQKLQKQPNALPSQLHVSQSQPLLQLARTRSYSCQCRHKRLSLNTKPASLASPPPSSPLSSPLSSSTASSYNPFLTNTMGKRDPSTASNYHVWRTSHTTTYLKIDFDAQTLHGTVQFDFKRGPETDAAELVTANEIILDSSYVDVTGVTIDDEAVPFEVKPRTGPLGAPLHISLPANVKDSVSVRLQVSTTDKCTALQWLTPAQTSNKKAPFMFSQAQAIHGRSIFPCQDTPDVKSTYSFRIASPYPVVASGLKTNAEAEAAAIKAASKYITLGADDTLYVYEQTVPMPSYLFALASGDIATASIGDRSLVATSPDQVDACQWELKEDMNKFLDVIEKLVFPYQWGEYNVLVLPPSFPYGGMENPVYTFATPTIISGDRQNVDVIAHELSHSWSGNLVTSGSWEHYWLNEGWTVYLERRIIAAVHGEAHFDFSAVLGWKALGKFVYSV